MAKQHLLSKSTFIRSLQCQKSLYLYKNFPELRDTISDEQQAIFDRGHNVGFLAQQLFPGGEDVGWKSPKQYKKSVKKTQELIEEGCRVIYEASFLWNDTLVALDILVKTPEGWKGYEVKSSMYVSETFLRDAALQYYIISQSGLQLADFNLVHLNRTYIHSGKLELDKLFKIESVYWQIMRRYNSSAYGLEKARETLSSKLIPDVDIGTHCHSPYPCDFRDHCWQNTQSSDSIFSLKELEEERKWSLYSSGVTAINEIPEDFPLTERQKIELTSLSSGEIFMDKEAIQKVLDKIKAPATFLDLQISRPAVPLLRGTKPYQRIPFMYTLTSRKENESEETETKHFLAEAGDGVQERFLKQFLKDTEGLPQLITFSQNDEIAALKETGKQFPYLQTEINRRCARMINLGEIFSKRMFFHPGIGGSQTLPDLLQAFGIEMEEISDFPIRSNYMAGVAFEYLFKLKDIIEIGTTRQKLIHYSKNRSLAAKLILDALVKELSTAFSEKDSELVK